MALKKGKVSRPLLLFYLADTHAHYGAYARILTIIDKVLNDNPGSAILVVINGDIFEVGDIIGKRSAGAGDWVFLSHLRKRVPILINVGNHEFDFQSPKDWLFKARSLDLATISNLQLRVTEGRLMDASFEFQDRFFPGFATPALQTYVPAVRDQLVIPNPADSFHSYRQTWDLPSSKILPLSHAGISHDREILDLMDGQFILAGSHNHQKFQYNFPDKSSYFQQGFRGESVCLIRLPCPESQLPAGFETIQIEEAIPMDRHFANELKSLQRDFLERDDLQTIGRLPGALAFDNAVQWAVDTIACRTDADFALVNHTSFGSGLPGGDVSRYAFSTFVRFENQLVEAECRGDQIKKFIALIESKDSIPLSERSGSVLFGSIGNREIEDHGLYRFVTSDWVALEQNQESYLGLKEPIKFRPLQGMTVSGVLEKELASA